MNNYLLFKAILQCTRYDLHIYKESLLKIQSQFQKNREGV